MIEAKIGLKLGQAALEISVALAIDKRTHHFHFPRRNCSERIVLLFSFALALNISEHLVEHFFSQHVNSNVIFYFFGAGAPATLGEMNDRCVGSGDASFVNKVKLFCFVRCSKFQLALQHSSEWAVRLLHVFRFR